MSSEFRIQGVYTYGMIATFISCIYSNAFYLESYLKTNDKKQKLEIDILREKEIALQSQLNALKAQIDTHFLFNNFSILSELIVEDQELAGNFLANLSKVYRYVIQNMERNTIPIAEEVKFLDSYLYLIGMRYGEAVKVYIDDELRNGAGYIPPVSLQLLVENAIKHNRHSKESPLHINIQHTDQYIIVSNLILPLLSGTEIKSNTGIGQKNIAERYLLLSSEKVIINKTAQAYSIKLPILKN
jgi:LytS/YehU family sensor histidine kinase